MSRAPEPSAEQLKNRWVSFRILDVYLPEPLKLLMDLHGRDILQGQVVDLSDNGTESFIVVEVEGIEQPVIVPAVVCPRTVHECAEHMNASHRVVASDFQVDMSFVSFLQSHHAYGRGFVQY